MRETQRVCGPSRLTVYGKPLQFSRRQIVFIQMERYVTSTAALTRDAPRLDIRLSRRVDLSFEVIKRVAGNIDKIRIRRVKWRGLT